MRIASYIVIKKSGSKYAPRYHSRLTQNSPALASNEIAVKIALEIPDGVFEKPLFEAKVSVPEAAVSRPVIEAEVIDNVEKIIKQNTGFEVKLEIVAAE